MRILKIPSVVEFHLKDKVEDFLAKELFQISRNLGSRFVSDSKIQNLENSNVYLNRQFDRLRMYAKTGQIEKFDYLADKLLKKSNVYRVYALNHVFPNYTSATVTKWQHWLEDVEQLASTSSNEFIYKRVWIDKLPGDAARPLGVPTPCHRIYGHMMTRIMEAYLCGTDQYTNNQHGGTPGRGTMTYIKELAKQFLKHKRIYEFDLKGYFDHLSHKSITDLFQSKVILHYLSGVLKAKPSMYSLPEEWEDYASKIHNDLLETKESIIDDLVEIMTPDPGEDDPAELVFALLQNEGDSPDDVLTKLMEEISEFTELEIPLEAVYSSLMKGEQLTLLDLLDQEKFTYMHRAFGRDKWKDLDLPEQGVPQGSSFGPVLASVLLGRIMPKDSLIYMDDGIVFMKDSDHRDTETMNESYNRRVSTIMCEVNRTKSRVLETSDLLTKGLKIIGTRWHRVRSIWSDSISVSSETRKGISRLLFTPTPLETEKIFAEFLNNGLITPSKRRLLRWYIHKGKLNRIVGSELFDIASRIKILGNILTRAYSPEVDLESMKTEIELGIFKAELSLKSSYGSLGERVINGCKTILLETTEGPIRVKPTLYNVRAICNDVLLRYLKGERPMRKLRVSGLRRPWDPKDRILKASIRQFVRGNSIKANKR